METNEKHDVMVNNTAEHNTENPSVTLAGIDIEDRGEFEWGIVGLLAPVIGLILHLIMRRSLPRNAKALKTGVIISLVLVIAYIAIVIVATMLFMP